MKRLTDELLQEIAAKHDIEYVPIHDPDPLIVRTQMAKIFQIDQEVAFDAFADPMAHIPLFEIIKGSTPPIRMGIEKLIPANQFMAFEHVEEANLPPRLMLVRYTLDRPHKIVKEAVTDPFLAENPQFMDRKRGLVVLSFEKQVDASTKLVAESKFHATTGSIFARGFIDHVWMNFFERVMLARGMLAEAQFLTNR